MEIAGIVREHKDRIIRQWVDRVKLEIPEVSGYERPMIENSIPDLIEAIIGSLERDGGINIHSYSRQHAIQRSHLKSYSLKQVIREYNLLKREIFNVTEEYSEIIPQYRDIILFTIDHAIEQAAETYFRIREEAHINARNAAEKKADDLELKDENREDFIQSITHDLNAPLNNIKGCIKLLEDNHEIDQVNRILQILKGSAHQAEILIKDFLDAATITSNSKLPVQKAKTNILEELNREILVFRTAHLRTIEFTSNRHKIDAELDIDLIIRAFHNLLGNAIRHGSKSSAITVSCTIENNLLIISVHNFGRQIPADALDAIFGRYYKIDKIGSGWGIGLAFVREVARAHGGEVTAKSNAEEGNLFEIKIPVH
jgi:signal transduction histidine kinase